jgi:hypothetical protein
MTLAVTFQNSPLSRRVLREDTGVATVMNNVLGDTGTLYSLSVTNPSPDAFGYLKIWDHKNPELGVDIPDYTFQIDKTGNPFIMNIFSGIPFANGFSYAFTFLPADLDITNPDIPLIMEAIFE